MAPDIAIMAIEDHLTYGQRNRVRGTALTAIPKLNITNFFPADAVGFEPTTSGLEVLCIVRAMLRAPMCHLPSFAHALSAIAGNSRASKLLQLFYSYTRPFGIFSGKFFFTDWNFNPPPSYLNMMDRTSGISPWRTLGRPQSSPSARRWYTVPRH